MWLSTNNYKINFEPLPICFRFSLWINHPISNSMIPQLISSKPSSFDSISNIDYWVFNVSSSLNPNIKHTIFNLHFRYKKRMWALDTLNRYSESTCSRCKNLLQSFDHQNRKFIFTSKIVRTQIHNLSTLISNPIFSEFEFIIKTKNEFHN